MVITLIEYAIYLQAITAHNGDELDPHSGKLNTFPPPSQQNCVSFYLIDSQQWTVLYFFNIKQLTFLRTYFVHL